MKPDLDKYMPHVESFELSDEGKRELLQAVWSVLENLVDREFGYDSTQQALDAAAADETGVSSQNRLVSNYNTLAKRQKETDRKDENHDCQQHKGRHLRARF